MRAASAFVSMMLLALPLVAGCTDEEPEGTIPEQLELLDVSLGVEGEFEALTRSGLLTVTGEGRDFAILVDDAAAEPITMNVHSPGVSDLFALDGREAQVELSEPDFSTNTRSIVISDDSGVLYAADHGTRRDLIEEHFGAGFVDYGAEVGSQTKEGYDWTYFSAKFQTDDGAVEILPGDSETITVDGVMWRVVVVAAYQSEPLPDTAVPGCGGSDDLLSYEILRVDQEVARETIVRPEGKRNAAISCGG